MNKKNFLGAAAVIVLAASGCSLNQSPSQRIYTPADNEIASYARIDHTKTQLVIGLLRTNDITSLIDGFCRIHPEVQPVIVYLQTSTGPYYPPLDMFSHGILPDIVFNIDRDVPYISEYLENLSGFEAASHYRSGSLLRLEQNSRLYYLPGPSYIMAVAYNKKLFAQYGWTIPSTFSEFIALCSRIQKDTGGKVEPYNPNGKYERDFITGLEGFTFGEIFSGIDNSAWYDDFMHGHKTFRGHMEPFFAFAQTMISAGLIKPAHLTYSYTSRSADFRAGRIAMMNVIIDPSETTDASIYGFFPFPSFSGSGSYIPVQSDFCECLTKRSRTPAEQKAAADFLNYISTPEAQHKLTNNSVIISPLKHGGFTFGRGYELFSEAVQAGRGFERRMFTGGIIPHSYSVIKEIRSAVFEMADGKLDADQALDQCDRNIRRAELVPPSQISQETAGTASADFTMLETSEYIADKFKEAAGADIAVIPHNSIYCGNISRYFAGLLTRPMLDADTPRSLDAESSLVRADMTGAQISAMLNDPPFYNGADGNCIYAFSGLKASVDPWNMPGKRYLSVTLADGRLLKSSQRYRVAFWEGMVKPQYAVHAVKICNGTFSDFMFNAVKKEGTISPPGDGRLTLVWK